MLRRRRATVSACAATTAVLTCAAMATVPAGSAAMVAHPACMTVPSGSAAMAAVPTCAAMVVEHESTAGLLCARRPCFPPLRGEAGGSRGIPAPLWQGFINI